MSRLTLICRKKQGGLGLPSILHCSGTYLHPGMVSCWKGKPWLTLENILFPAPLTILPWTSTYMTHGHHLAKMPYVTAQIQKLLKCMGDANVIVYLRWSIDSGGGQPRFAPRLSLIS
ncbi:hypothetical protein GDO81_028335 [Engystomops pustulosus]|uniref:Uncharacterized protein n=1 Tax=Engystomops pustulosus TaxID=76066 RepID=A0AAV6Z373_ENGPU|nr:hypothetical protein GDO81_028335 [Engystomops pustulosus]